MGAYLLRRGCLPAVCGLELSLQVEFFCLGQFELLECTTVSVKTFIAAFG